MEEFINAIRNRLETFFDPQTLGTLVANTLADIIVGLVIFFAFYLFWILFQPVLKRILVRTHLDETGVIFVTTILKYTIYVIGLINALSAAGINTGSVLASLGIAGLTIGFAARDAFSNLISGLLIYLDRPFVIGDLVEIESYYGRVDQITLRSTRIITSDGKMLAVPNADIINKTVASYTNFPHLRLDIPVTVGVNENLGRVRAILLELVAENPNFLTDPAPRVVVTQLNDYNVTMALQVWLKNERLHVETRFDLRESVFNALTKAGIDMPYETIQLRPIEIQS
ncbi:MAG: mechanosensitive ion channel family protein [Candidatus Promineifilaceae bacterium]